MARLTHRCFLAFAGAALTGILLKPAPAGATALSLSEAGIGPSVFAGPVSVTVSPDGSHVYATGGRAIVVFERDEATGLLQSLETQMDGEGGVDGIAGAASVATSPDGTSVYVVGFDDDAVALFARNAQTGTLTFVEARIDGVGGVRGLDGAAGVAVSPDGMFVYVAGAIDGALAVFERDGQTGALTFIEAHFDGVGGVDGLRGAIDHDWSGASGKRR